MIPTVNYSLEEVENGVMLSFNVPVSGIKPKDQYIVYFDCPVTLPENPPTTVSFEPSSGSYVIFGQANLKPKAFTKIKSVHRSQTQSLIRLTIKDTLNTTLYIDYLLVVATPQTTIELSASLLSTSTVGNIGPRGGSIIRLGTNTGNMSQLDVGMIVKGPGIPQSAQPYYIVNLLTNTDIELDRLISTNVTLSGTYQFIRQVGCVDATSLLKRTAVATYTVLDSHNNWTYKVNNKLIAKFIPYQDNDTVVLLPIKNSSLLTAADEPLPIPDITIIQAGGRLMGDTSCVSEIIG